MVKSDISNMTKTQKYAERTKNLLEEHGWKLSIPPTLIPKEDRCKLNGGLRCFRMVFDRDENANKLQTMHRCGHPAARGSFFCKKKHGGGNQRALVNGSRSMVASAFRGAFKNPIGALFDAFLADPTLMDLKPQLAVLNTCLQKYLEKVNTGKKAKSSRKAIAKIAHYMNNETMEDVDKWKIIQSFCASQTVLTDGESLHNIIKIIDAIGKLVERIDKIQSKDEFMMTPDGLKILIRCVIDSIRENVDEETLKKIKTNIISISTRTQGDLKQYKGDIEEAKFKMVK